MLTFIRPTKSFHTKLSPLSSNYGKGNIFMRDELPTAPIAAHESGIVNLDSSENSGTHWVAYYNDPKNKFVEYVDSFGHPPPEEVIKYLKTSGKEILYNSNKLQMSGSDYCGYFAAYYIARRESGASPHQAIYELDQGSSEKNEEMVSSYFTQKK